MATERICVETRGYLGADLGRQWDGDGRRVLPCPTLDELDERDAESGDVADLTEDTEP